HQDFDFKHLFAALGIENSTGVYYVTRDEYQYQQRYYNDATSTIGL
ncbi:15714_t:CDS:1, partial [Racocetra persica]